MATRPPKVRQACESSAYLPYGFIPAEAEHMCKIGLGEATSNRLVRYSGRGRNVRLGVAASECVQNELIGNGEADIAGHLRTFGAACASA